MKTGRPRGDATRPFLLMLQCRLETIADAKGGTPRIPTACPTLCREEELVSRTYVKRNLERNGAEVVLNTELTHQCQT